MRTSGTSPAVQIGTRSVGDGLPVLVIAEAGVNHDGSVERAIAMIDAAATAGADVVKFQMFRADELAVATAGVAAYQRAAGAASQRDMLARLELSDAAFARLFEACCARGIEFLATPFGTSDVDRLVRLGARAIKIASTELNNAPLLAAAARTGLSLVVSTGAADEAEIRAAVQRLDGWGVTNRLVLLHCVSGYPTPVTHANLRAIASLRTASGVPCGFSDHTQSVEIAGWAVAAGACVLEKHFTLDRTAPGPDHAMSMEPAQLSAYIAAARAAFAAMGSGRLGMTPIERDVRAVARRSVVAVADIPAGATLAAEQLGVKRPGTGIPPDELERLVGRRARVAIARDTLLAWDMVE